MYLSEVNPGDPNFIGPVLPKSGFDWGGIFNTVPSLFNSVASLFGKKSESPSLYSQLQPEPKKSNALLYVVGGVAAVTIVGTIIALNRRPRVSSRT